VRTKVSSEWGELIIHLLMTNLSRTT